jgi:hypothetical protein
MRTNMHVCVREGGYEVKASEGVCEREKVKERRNEKTSKQVNE